MDKILRDGLIPLEPIRDILANSYASISYIMGHEVVAPLERYVKAFMCLVGAWSNLHTDPLTPLVDLFKECLMQEL